jgi:hypothetical protein
VSVSPITLPTSGMLSLSFHPYDTNFALEIGTETVNN